MNFDWRRLPEKHAYQPVNMELNYVLVAQWLIDIDKDSALGMME